MFGGCPKLGNMKNKKVIGGYRWGIKANNDPNGSKWEDPRENPKSLKPEKHQKSIEIC